MYGVVYDVCMNCKMICACYGMSCACCVYGVCMRSICVVHFMYCFEDLHVLCLCVYDLRMV